MTNLEIITEVKYKLIENSCALRHTFKVTETGAEKLAGDLIAESDTILFKQDNKKHYIISIDDNYGHGNFRNTLAKEFVKTFTLEQLQNEFIETQNRKYNEALEQQKQAEIDKKYFTDIIEKLKIISNIGEFHIGNWGSTKRLNWEIDIRNNSIYKNQLHATIKIDRKDNILNVAYTTCDNGVYYNENYNRIFTESKFINWYTDIMQDINNKLEVIKAERQAIDKQIDDEAKVYAFCRKVISSGNEYIFKTKQSAFCVRGRTKFALKGEGKYQNTDASKLCDIIKSKGITEYCVMNESESAYDMRKNLDTLKFEKIAV